jgi:hypothetical protein
VVIEGGGTTVTLTVADFVVSAIEVATIDTVRFAETVAGALYVADVVVTFVSVPQAAPVQLLPDTAHVAPFCELSFDMLTEKFIV